jgi:hypothetical protein
MMLAYLLSGAPEYFQGFGIEIDKAVLIHDKNGTIC